MGYPNGEIPMLDVHGYEVAGATFPVPIWHLYMAAAEAHLPSRQFLTPNAYPVFKYVTHGYFGVLGEVAPSTTTVTTTMEPAAAHTASVPAGVAKPSTIDVNPTPAPTTTRAPTPPPATTAPPATTVAPPPPATTTEPAPPPIITAPPAATTSPDPNAQ
jgi:hypothetical protein